MLRLVGASLVDDHRHLTPRLKRFQQRRTVVPRQPVGHPVERQPLAGGAGGDQVFLDGDINLDCFVNLVDFSLLAAKFLNCSIHVCP